MPDTQTAPQPVVARDLCDMSATADKLGRYLKYAGEALGAAFEGDRREQACIGEAVSYLRMTRDRLPALIREVEAL